MFLVSSALAKEAINAGAITELNGYNKIEREVKYGNENSRIDIMLSDSDKPDAFIEVKSVPCSKIVKVIFLMRSKVPTRTHYHSRKWSPRGVVICGLAYWHKVD